jgi:hypothetical protein
MPVHSSFDSLDLHVTINRTWTFYASAVSSLSKKAIIQHLQLPYVQKMLHMQPFALGVLSALLLFLPFSLQQDSDVRDQNNCRRWGHQTCVIDDRLYLDGGRVSLVGDLIKDTHFELQINQSSIMKSDLGNPSPELTGL